VGDVKEVPAHEILASKSSLDKAQADISKGRGSRTEGPLDLLAVPKVPAAVAKEAEFVSTFAGLQDKFNASVVGSWAKQDPAKMPDRAGPDTSDFDVILTPKPSSATGLKKFKERDERNELVEQIKTAWPFKRPLQIHEGEVASTSKSIPLTTNAAEEQEYARLMELATNAAITDELREFSRLSSLEESR